MDKFLQDFQGGINKFLRDTQGGPLVENALILPIFLAVTLGAVDFSYMLSDWSMANKAAFSGARAAVVSDPVAGGITNVSYSSSQIAQLGNWCFDTGTGSNINCPSPSSVCTPNSSSSGSCTNGHTFNNTAFGTIFGKMQELFPRLQRQNVQIVYNANGLGFVGQPNGLPMNVTVSIECMTHQFYFISGLMGWAFTAPSNYTNPSGNGPACPATVAGPRIPRFATTLTSESMVTN